MTGKILIANRGEIAIRIARTARALGQGCVTVYATDDAGARHARLKGSHALPGRGVDAYLDQAALIHAAQETGCALVHPGYGFLSESADFARACAAAGLSFVGPSPETLEQLGNKIAARRLVAAQGGQVIEGSGMLKAANEAAAFFQSLNGGAMMLKAAHGGGGRGMRIIRQATEINESYARCRSEAENAFGDGTLFAERFIENARHIEVQIIGDGHRAQSLGDRDCSLQRRHQKVVEIAPAPHLPEATRDAMHETAVTLATGCGYRGLATIEFLYDGREDKFWFIEANPRLQVEHTVTEEITGLDLVELQLGIAAGAHLGDLGLESDRPAEHGIALQARISAERLTEDGAVHPARGQITMMEVPGGSGIRIDGHAFTGYQPNPAFDPLLAKLIIHERSGHLARLRARAAEALAEFHMEGLDTNLGFLQNLMDQPALDDWSVTTDTLRALTADLCHPRLERAAASRPSIHEHSEPEPAFRDEVITLRAPMQAALVDVSVAPGDTVRQGQEIAILEALKMQHGVAAPRAGTILSLHAEPGDILGEGALILALVPDQDVAEMAQQAAQADPDFIRPDLQNLLARVAVTLDENRPKAMARRRARDQCSTRENINAVLQGGAFHEYGQLVLAGQRRKHGRDAMINASPADGIVTGIGTLNGAQFAPPRNQVALLAYDSTVMAGTQGMFGHMKTDRILEIAAAGQLASIFFTEGGGGRPNDTDFADVLHSGLGVTTFSAFAALQGWGPKITVNSGYCFAGNAALFGAGDVRIATRNAWIGLGGPAMIEAGGLGTFSPKEVGPAPMHAQTGLVDLLVETDAEAAEAARRIMTLFQGDLPPGDAPDQRLLRHAVPEDRKRAYAMRDVITLLADDDSFVELGAGHAPGLITGLCRINGRALAVMANNPMHLGGALDAPASAKGARFLRLCDRFNLRVLSLCDTPGFMVGPESEEQGAVAAACDFIAAGASLREPMLFVCLRKGYGIGAQAMAGGSFANPAFTLAWPSGEFGAMGLEGAVRLGFKKELEAETDDTARAALFERHVAHAYSEGGALNMASLQEIDAVIDPKDTRDWILRGLDMAART